MGIDDPLTSSNERDESRRISLFSPTCLGVRTRGEATHGHAPWGATQPNSYTHRRYGRSSASAHLNSTKQNLCTHRPQTQEADPHTKRDARSRGATWRAHTCGSYT
jgi:hypothetical protein